MAPTAFAPVWWVARWLARVVTALAMAAFTALTLTVGTGPAVAADVPPAVPASVTLAVPTTDAAADQPAADERPGLAAPAQVAPVHHTSAWGRGWRPTIDVVPGAAGQRAPPLR